MFAVDVDVRHRAFEIAQKITEGSITRLDYVDNSKLIFETANCLKHLHEALGYAEDDAAGLEAELDEANAKIAEQAQKIVELRHHLGEIRQDNDGLSALAEREAGRVDEFNERQISDFHVSQLVSENNSLTQTIEDLRAENARLKAAGDYLRKPRRSYLAGTVSAIGDVVRLVVGGGR